MPPQLTARLKGITDTLAKVSLGQKVLILIGVAVLALGVTAFATWATKPTYVPLFTNLAADDASAITTQLDADKVKYQLDDGGATILVPQESVNPERLKAAAAGLPSSSKTGYALLDAQGITSSQFQQKVTYQRALEGELEKTIEGLDGVNTAVVHLAVPEETVFTDAKGKTTASVLVDTAAGTTLSDDQIQTIRHLVSSSVPDLDVNDVSLADANGTLLAAAGSPSTGGQSDAQTTAYNQATQARIQAMLDKVLGPGKAVASVSAELNYDQTQLQKTTFTQPTPIAPLSESATSETYGGSASGVGGALGSNGILGMDQEEANATVNNTNTGAATGSTSGSGYVKKTDTVNNSIDKQVEETTVAPGALKRQSIAVVVDSAAAAKAGLPQLTELVSSAAGADATRGDTVSVVKATFDTSGAKAAASELAAAKKAQAAAARMSLIKQGAIALAILIAFLIVLIMMRRAAKKRRREAVDLGELERMYPGPALDPDAMLALEAMGSQLTPPPPDPAALRRAEVGDMVDAQPAEVADVLRGWLTETKVG